MPLLSFFARRLATGLAARLFTQQLVKRFKVSPGVANLIFVVLTEVIARQGDRAASSGGTGATKPAPTQPAKGAR